MLRERGDTWESLWSDFDALRVAVRKSKAQNVNAARLRATTKGIVQSYFRSIRPELMGLGIAEPVLAELDRPMQDLLRLSNGSNNKSSYMKSFDAIRRHKGLVDIQRLMLLGAGLHKSGSSAGNRTEVEKMIAATLEQLLPSAALSYEQALRDLAGPPRVSYRGTAVEVRESLRELLDHLAPDAAVTKEPGFTYEKDQKKPTMKQKARFILKNRGGPQATRASAEDAVVRIEEATASLARSVYTRGSVSTHVATTLAEVRQLKLYADAVLAELLEILEPKA